MAQIDQCFCCLPFNFFEHEKEKDDLWSKISSTLNSEQTELIPYSFLLQKQPGSQADEFIGQLILPDNTDIFWKYPDDLDAQNGWNIAERLDADKYWSILINK